MDNPHYITMEEYLKILESALGDTIGPGFDRPSHPEDISAAVEMANKHVEAVLSYQVRKWYDDNKPSRIVTMPDDISEEEAKRIKQAYQEAYQKL